METEAKVCIDADAIAVREQVLREAMRETRKSWGERGQNQVLGSFSVVLGLHIWEATNVGRWGEVMPKLSLSLFCREK